MLDQRQQHVDGGLVGADQHAAALQVAQVAHRRFGLLGQPHQALRVVEEHPAGLGELAVLGRPVEEPLAEVVFETADGLADRRLRAVQPGGGAREAALRGDGQKDLKFGEIHGRQDQDGRMTGRQCRVPSSHSAYASVKIINLTNDFVGGLLKDLPLSNRPCWSRHAGERVGRGWRTRRF